MIACLGLAFKANIDDLRESPALEIVAMLADARIGGIVAVEPNISALPQPLRGKIELMSMADAINAADIIVLLVDHREFTSMDGNRMLSKVLIDTRGVLARG